MSNTVDMVYGKGGTDTNMKMSRVKEGRSEWTSGEEAREVFRCNVGLRYGVRARVRVRRQR
jgi:hypothetical protein